jgi:hypothetical protein
MLLTREHLKQAIDAIDRREPEIAYTLNDMLGKGRIDVPPASDPGEDKRLYFIFGDTQAFVNKVQFFNSGTPPLEQALLIQYGEMAQKRSLLNSAPFTPPGKLASKADTAGLSLMINYEIDLAAAQLKKQIATTVQKKGQANENCAVNSLRQRLGRLADIRNDGSGQIDVRVTEEDPRILFQGIISDYTRASFMRFPFSRESLMQAARLNLEFFHIRFLLNCLISGTDNLLFACMVKGELQGLVFLEIIRKLFYSLGFACFIFDFNSFGRNDSLYPLQPILHTS